MTPMNALDPSPPICVNHRLRRPICTSIHYASVKASTVARKYQELQFASPVVILRAHGQVSKCDSLIMFPLSRETRRPEKPPMVMSSAVFQLPFIGFHLRCPQLPWDSVARRAVLSTCRLIVNTPQMDWPQAGVLL